ncbi:Wdr35 [Symbiodinium pilosum]|uniref:Wdr35 protein n=1 Tax=Symbiodinium pilosum TaxID=2952 RepID=A0A812RCW0_SYMPI|nr:Wdr35 [Symbiodinium pilosum]
MVLAAFLVDAEAGTALALRPMVEGASFVAGDDWQVGAGLAAGLELPLAKALRFAAWAFATVVGRGTQALALESVKLLPVTEALEASDCQVLSSLPNELEAEVATALHGRKVGVLCGAALLDYLQQLAGRTPRQEFAAAWLGYDGGRACTSTQLHSCSEWSHLNELLSLQLLSKNALLAVTVAYVSTAEVWSGSAVDWTLAGLRQACSRHGYTISAASVMKFTANNSRLALFVRLGGQLDNAQATLPPALLGAVGCEDAAVEFHSTWDEARVKTPSPEGRRLRHLLPLLQQILAAGSGAVIHEPGFTLVPDLAACTRLTRLSCCTCDDPVVLCELRRQGREVFEASSAPEEVLRQCSVLMLLEDCGPKAWQHRWKDLSTRWLRLHHGQEDSRLVLFLEASQLQAALELIGELKADAGGQILCSFSFVQGSRRWAFAAVSLAQAAAPLRLALPQLQGFQKMFPEDFSAACGVGALWALNREMIALRGSPSYRAVEVGPTDLAFFHQTNALSSRVNFSISSVRQHLPHAPYYLLSDGGPDFSPAARELNISTFRAESGMHLSKFFNQNFTCQAHLQRIAEAARWASGQGATFLMIWEDDTRLLRPPHALPDVDLNTMGNVANTHIGIWNAGLREKYLKNPSVQFAPGDERRMKQHERYAARKGYSAGPGSIWKISSFLQALDAAASKDMTDMYTEQDMCWEEFAVESNLHIRRNPEVQQIVWPFSDGEFSGDTADPDSLFLHLDTLTYSVTVASDDCKPGGSQNRCQLKDALFCPAGCLAKSPGHCKRDFPKLGNGTAAPLQGCWAKRPTLVEGNCGGFRACQNTWRAAAQRNGGEGGEPSWSWPSHSRRQKNWRKTHEKSWGSRAGMVWRVKAASSDFNGPS